MDFLESLQFEEESRGEQRRAEGSRGERDEEPPCSRKLGRPSIGKEPETPPAESALRIAPVCKGPPAESALRIAPVCKGPRAARARGRRDQDKTPKGEPGIGVQYWNQK